MKPSLFFSTWKQAVIALFITPLCSAALMVLVVVPSATFFLSFFTVQASAELRPFFVSIPAVSVLVLPLLVFRLRSCITDDSLPVFPFIKLFALSLAALCAYLVALILLLAIPFCVQSFGDVEPGQLFTGYSCILLYGLTAIALCICLFSFFPAHPAVALLFSMLFLTLAHTIHLLGQFLRPQGVLAFFVQNVSFSWHFDAAGKGIFDTRDVFFYVFATFLLLLMATIAEYHRTGRTCKRIHVLLLASIVVCGSIASYRLYARVDFTSSRRYSVSAVSRQLCLQIEEPLRITYYRSNELVSAYQATQDIAEYLTSYAQLSRNISFEVKKTRQQEIQHLQSRGVNGTQLRITKNGRTEYVTVYSTIILDYLDSELILPLVLSTETLEYDITRRIQELVSGVTRAVYVVIGNGLSQDVETGYGYVLPYLERMGFTPHALLPSELPAFLEHSLPEKSVLLVLGSSAFTEEEAYVLEHLIKDGVPALIETSPYTVAISDDWTITKNAQDALIPALRAWGFAFENALAQDISCFPLSLQSGNGGNAEYQTVNYPQWISLMPQKASPQGMTLFWPSPLSLYGDATALLVTSPYAWLQHEAAHSTAQEDLFITNPFLLAKTASEAGATAQSLILAARLDDGSGSGLLHGYFDAGVSRSRVTVIADQYALNSLMTAYISHASAGDFRNYDFMTSELLHLRGEDAFAALLQKKSVAKTLYKLSDEEAFSSEKKRTLVFVFAVLPLLIIMLQVAVSIRRRSVSE